MVNTQTPSVYFAFAEAPEVAAPSSPLKNKARTMVGRLANAFQLERKSLDSPRHEKGKLAISSFLVIIKNTSARRNSGGL